jgi:hypothetical protein
MKQGLVYAPYIPAVTAQPVTGSFSAYVNKMVNSRYYQTVTVGPPKNIVRANKMKKLYEEISGVSL